jgi:hypothetical protein
MRTLFRKPGSQLVPGDGDQNGLFRSPGRSSHVAVPLAPGCRVAHSAGPFSQNGLRRPDERTARRRTASTGAAASPVVFPPKRDSYLLKKPPRNPCCRSRAERRHGTSSVDDDVPGLDRRSLPVAIMPTGLPRAATPRELLEVTDAYLLVLTGAPLRRSVRSAALLIHARANTTKRPNVGGQIRRLSIGGRDASPARPEGLRRPPGRKVPGLASHRTRAASRPQPASE